jgi:hypothetical protein
MGKICIEGKEENKKTYPFLCYSFDSSVSGGIVSAVNLS